MPLHRPGSASPRTRAMSASARARGHRGATEPRYQPGVEMAVPPRIQEQEETMLRKLMTGAVATVTLVLASAALAQGQFGSAAEAKAMLEKAVAELKANEAAALAKFNKGEGGF